MGAEVALRVEPETESCPWCGNAISRQLFTEIEGRIAEQERKRLAQERARMQNELLAQRQSMEANLRKEAEEKVAAIVAKQAEREATIRKEVAEQVEVRAKTESAKKLATLTAERDQGAAKLREFETAALRHKKDLEQQRLALEKDRDEQLVKVQAQHARLGAQQQEKIERLMRQLQRKTADDLGDGAEVDVYEALRDAFSRDAITRIKKGQPGADIRHDVLHKGEPCGTILFDSKNRQGWQNGYVTKLREDQMAAKADYAVLATSVFPTGKKELYVDDQTGVIVVSRARVVEIVGLLRGWMVRIYRLRLSASERSQKRDLIYKYITSEDYRRHHAETARLASQLADLDVEEQRTHGQVWEKRGRMTARLRNAVREIDSEISAILEGGSPGERANA